MTSNFRASSRMASEFYSNYSNSSKSFYKKFIHFSIYSSYSDSSEFFYNSSTYFIFKKSSSSSTNSSKSVFFAFTHLNIMYSNSFYECISLIEHWSYQYSITSKMINVDLYMIEDTRSDKRNRQIVDCKLCHFIVFVNKWQYANLCETHVNACPDCFFSQDVIYSRIEHARAEEIRLIKERAEFLIQQQIEEARFVEEARLIEQARIENAQTKKIWIAKQHEEVLLAINRRLAERQIEKARRIEQVRIEKKRAEVFACRRCNAKFSSNIKFHNHVQNHHQKKFAIEFAMLSSSSSITSSEIVKFTSNEIVISTSFSTSIAKLVKITTNEFAETTSFATFSSSSESALMLISSFSQSKSISKFSLSDTSFDTSIATSIATSKKIFWVEIVSRSIIASKTSRLSIFTSRFVSKALKTAAVVCSSTSSSIFSQKSVSKHQHQKFYLTIEDLFEMFDEKIKRTSSSHVKHYIKKNAHSRNVFSLHQISITFYFKFAINQSKSINQSSKTSNPRSFQQHMSAKSNRAKSILSKWFEKSIILSYKTSIFSRLHISEISSNSSYKMSNISDLQSMIAFCKSSTHLFVSSISRAFFDIFVFSHACRICNDIFESNNVLHRHLRAIHFNQTSRRHLKSSSKRDHLGRNLENSWFFDEDTDHFFASLFVLLINFSWMNHMFSSRDTTRALWFFLVRWHLLRLNLHIELKSEYFDKNELASWQSDSYLALCLLDSNNSIILSFIYYILHLLF